MIYDNPWSDFHAFYNGWFEYQELWDWMERLNRAKNRSPAPFNESENAPKSGKDHWNRCTSGNGSGNGYRCNWGKKIGVSHGAQNENPGIPVRVAFVLFDIEKHYLEFVAWFRAVLKQIVLRTMLSFSKRVDLNNGMTEHNCWFIAWFFFPTAIAWQLILAFLVNFPISNLRHRGELLFQHRWSRYSFPGFDVCWNKCYCPRFWASSFEKPCNSNIQQS